MAVIINDFEVVLDAPAASAAPPADETQEAAAPPGQRPMAPLDLEMVQRHLERRRERLRAH